MKSCECDPEVGFFCVHCCLENQYIQDLQNKYCILKEALEFIDSQYNGHVGDIAREALEKLK